MTTPFRRAILAASILALAPSALAAPSLSACKNWYSTLDERMTNLAKHFDAKETGGLGKTANAIRDGIRRQLQYWQGHEYPIVSMNDGTPIEAKVLAKSAFGETVPKPGMEPPPGSASLAIHELPVDPPVPDMGMPSGVGNYSGEDIAGIKSSVAATLDRVENYRTEIKSFVDETASMAAEKETLEAYLAKSGGRRSDIRIEKVPSVKFDKDGKPEFTYGSRYFDSEVRLRLRIKELGQELKKRMGRSLSGASETNNRALAQAIWVKKLEAFRGELMTQQSIHGGKALQDPETQKLFNRINALYSVDGKGVSKLKKEFQPPLWANDRLKWAQTHGEFASFWLKYYPSVTDEVKKNKLLEFIKNMSPEERRALGVDTIADTSDLMKRTRYWRVVPAAGASLTGIATGSYYYAIQPVYDLLITDARRKEECAAKGTEDEFVDCLHAYLEERFPKTYLLATQEKKNLLDGKGKINDPKIVAEIDDTVRRRNDFMHGENVTRELRDAAGAVVRDLSKGDTSVRQTIVEADSDAEFRKGILGAGPDDRTSYFAFQYPQNFAILRPKIEEVLNVPVDDLELRQRKLAELRRSSPSIAAELEQMLVDRDYFKQGFGLYNPSFPGGSGTIITTPGPIFNPNPNPGPIGPGGIDNSGTGSTPSRRTNTRPFNPNTDSIYYVVPNGKKGGPVTLPASEETQGPETDSKGK